MPTKTAHLQLKKTRKSVKYLSDNGPRSVKAVMPQLLPQLQLHPLSNTTLGSSPAASQNNLDICEENAIELLTVELNSELYTLEEDPHAAPLPGLKYLAAQVEKKTLLEGGLFNLMMVGEPGAGKRTLLNTLFGSELMTEDSANEPVPEGGILCHRYQLTENNFDLKLTIFNAPDYGLDIDNEYAWLPIRSYIEQQYRLYLFQSEQPLRQGRVDSRVHCCLYFISARGHEQMRPMDTLALKALSGCVNVVPVIAKCDTYDRDELARVKLMIQQTFVANDIRPCDLVECPDYEVGHRQHKPIASAVPFAVIGLNERHRNASGDTVRGRKYRWGLAEVENESHCDFLQMRHMLMSEYLLDLIGSTQEYYGQYRQQCLQARWEAASDNAKVDMLNGIAQYFKYTRIRYRDLEAPPSIGRALYDDGVRQLHQQRVETIAAYEARFKGWRHKLVQQQAALNQDVERDHQQLRDLEAEVKELQLLRRSSSDKQIGASSHDEGYDVLTLLHTRTFGALQRFATTL